MIIKYVVGLTFNEDESEILLIQKNRPQWQAGLFNGIGGKIELLEKIGKRKIYETPEQAIVREVEEEAGLITTEDDWKYFCKISYIKKNITNIDKQVIYFLKTNTNLSNYISKTDERVNIFNTENLPNNLVDKLPFILDIHKENKLYEIKVFV